MLLAKLSDNVSDDDDYYVDDAMIWGPLYFIIKWKIWKKKLKKIEKQNSNVMKPVIRFVLVIYATCAFVTEFFGIIWDKKRDS